MTTLTVFLQATSGGGLMGLLPWIGIFVVMYFFMIRPQVKKNKELKKFRAELAVGDKIVTMGGIHGKVKEITDTTVLLEAEGTKFRVEKSALSPSFSPDKR